MPHLSVPFSGNGPLIDLFVSVSKERRDALAKANQPIPPFQKARALIDSGASGTCIDPAVLAPLQLTATGIVPILTPSTAGKQHMCEQYDVSLAIDHPKNPMILTTIPVVATSFAGQGIQALIGRDVLSRCLFIFDGESSTFTLAF